MFDFLSCCCCSGSDDFGQRDYNREILRFFRDINYRQPPDTPQHNEPLDNLLQWSRRQIDRNTFLERTIVNRDSTINERVSEIEGLQNDLVVARSNFEEAKRRHQNEVEDMTSRFFRETEALKTKYEDTIEQIRRTNQRETETLVNEHEKRTKKLMSQLLVNQSDDKGWPDEKFVVKMSKLVDTIALVSATAEHPELQVPENRTIPSSIDTTNIIRRKGKSYLHLVLKYRIWLILQEEFFSQPFGFGALGSSALGLHVVTTYRNWLQLYLDKGEAMDGVTADNYMIFNGSKLANRWRAATFACFAELTEGQHESTGVEQAARRLHQVWLDIAKLSGNAVSSNVKLAMLEISRQARELSLQFGVHPARVQLIIPGHGDRAQIGHDIGDWQDGERHFGKTVNVDLVVSPGISRIGDGFRDMNTHRTIVPCKIMEG